MRKGFIHVLEAILVSLILIVSVPFLLNPGVKSDQWGNSRLTVTGQDILASLDNIDTDSDGESDLQDIMEMSTTDVDNAIFDITQRTGIGYNLRTVGSIKNEIRIGCSCTDEEKDELQAKLGLAYVNERIVIFRVLPMTYDSLGTLDFDVILVNGNSDLDDLETFYKSSQANENLIRSHLNDGKGIVEFVDLSSSDINEDLQKEIFGLASGASGSGDVAFSNTNDPSVETYYTGKYFYGVGISMNFTEADSRVLKLRNLDHNTEVNRTNEKITSIKIDINRNGVFDAGESFSEGDEFTIDLNGASLDYEIDKVDADREWVFINPLRRTEYRFHSFASDPVGPMSSSKVIAAGSSGSAVILNSTSDGRTVWVSSGEGDDVTGLLKSSIVWAAHEDWGNIIRTVSSTQSGVSYMVSQGEEIYEPYLVNMDIWTLF